MSQSALCDTRIQVQLVMHGTAICAAPQYHQGPFSTMSPLKRQRTNAGDDGREQKRTCGDLFPTNLVGDEQATWFQIGAAPSSQVQGVSKRCIHKIVTACNLPQATCCACLDARLDGLNFMYSLEEHVCGFSECRWKYYCFGCQGMMFSQL
jgi:hypothetical protein